MSIRRCNRRARVADARAVAAVLLALVPTVALALSNDREKPANIDADSFRTVQGRQAAKGSNVTVYKGDVVFSQGSIKGHGDEATVYQAASGAKDAGTGRIDRVVIVGKPAHIEQLQDDGTMMKADADTIDYRLNADTIELTGHVTLVQQGRGEFHGPHMTYNTTTGVMQSGGSGGRIHMTLQPKPAADGKAKPTAAETPKTPPPDGAH